MKENFIPEELVKAFLEHVEGKSFTLVDVAVALNLDDETAVSILIYLIENKILDVTCTWVPNKK
ncbi:hypothetical protein DBR11_21420 [Pedobacter sp. HMWF019]|uniref:hypothetical protein n=1 Tax=Pedobacter sp. HMWF019 TaxID=2056856 RepID=UPI000D38B61A|nr:hypothetical protein [Pedobacter sp. HMWF019]PTS95402.1 hypothetical protein DBR11_21420 [Pedobacter sp. HMWF019]